MEQRENYDQTDFEPIPRTEDSCQYGALTTATSSITTIIQQNMTRTVLYMASVQIRYERLPSLSSARETTTRLEWLNPHKTLENCLD